MKLTVNREQLLSAFQMAAAVAPQRSNKPILQSVKLEVTESAAVLSATDLEIGIRAFVSGVDSQEAGSVMLPVDRFGAILSTSSDSHLKIETSESTTVISGEHSKFKLPSEDPREFPNVAEFSETKYHQLSARALKGVIRRTAFAVSPQTAQFVLTGVLLEFAKDTLIAVATDGKRMATMQVPAIMVGEHLPAERQTIVPAKAMRLIERALIDPDAEVEVAVIHNELLVRTPQATICARLVEGRFPKWRDVLPKRPNATRIEFVVGPLNCAVQQAAIVAGEAADEKGNLLGGGVKFAFADGMLTLLSNESQRGQSHVELPIGFNGESLSVELWPKLVCEFLKVLDAESTFTFEIEGNESKVICRTDDGYEYAIMPLVKN
jgi:DNA polymerase III subunit beta